MTYLEIFQEIYHDNKKFIRTYIVLCLAISVLALGGTGRVQAGDEFTSSEMLTAVGGSFGKMAVLLPGVQSFLSDIDQPTVMLISSAIPFALDHFPEKITALGEQLGIKNLRTNLESYSFGLFENDAFKLICLIWFVLAKLSKSNRFTCTTGLILENKVSKLGGVINAIAVISQFLENIPSGSSAYAASDTVQPAKYVNHFGALICFTSLMALAVIYMFVRALFRFLAIMLHPVYLIVPFSSLAGTTAKSVGVGVMMLTAALHPALFGIAASSILLLSVVLFKKAYITIRYFKNIYVKPFFKKIRGYDREIPLVSPKLPQKLKTYTEEANAEIAIPVYPIKKTNGHPYVHKHDRWWLVSSQHRNYVYKPSFGRRGCYCIALDNNAEKKMFIRKSLRFFEIFDFEESGNTDLTSRKAHKDIHFVFSKEYFHRYEKIKEITMFTDFAEYKNQAKQNLKLSKKKLREQKRLTKQKNEAGLRKLKSGDT